MMTCIFQIFWFLLDRFGLPKIEKVFKSGWLQSFQLWPPGLVTLIPFGQVLAAKDWKSIQIWLLVRVRFHSFLKGCGWRVAGAMGSGPLQTMSNLIFWFGDFGSFWTRLGCQSFKKYSNLADYNHFIQQFRSPGLVTLIPFGQVWAAKAWKSIQIWLLVCPLFIPSWMVAAEGLRAL